jgi:hypothetical protein
MQEGEMRTGFLKRNQSKASKMEMLSQTTDASANPVSFLKGIFSEDPIHNPPVPYSSCGAGLFLNNFAREQAIAKMERESRMRKMSEIALALRNQGITQQIARFKERELDLRLNDLKQKEMMEEYRKMKSEKFHNQRSIVKIKKQGGGSNDKFKKSDLERLMKINKEKRSTGNLNYNIRYESVETRARVCTFKGKGHCYEDLLKPLDIKLRSCLSPVANPNHRQQLASPDFRKMAGRTRSGSVTEGRGVWEMADSGVSKTGTPNTRKRGESLASTASSLRGVYIMKQQRK